MNLTTTISRIAVGVLSVAMFATSGGLAAAVAGDFALRNHVPDGVAIGGIDVGGLTPAEARLTLERRVAKPLLRTLEVRAGGSTFEIDTATYVSVDIESAMGEALAPNRASTIAHRAMRMAAGTPVNLSIEPPVTFDSAALAETVASFADQVDTGAIDASIAIAAGSLTIRPSESGVRLDQDASVEALISALRDGDRSVDLPTVPIAPNISEEDLGRTVVIRLNPRTLDLYDGLEVDRTYRITVGKPGFATPQGSFEITAKRYWPTWGNPGSPWAANMPKMIPPGVGNPLGTRAINLDIPGVRIHGTRNAAAIGTAASHGCIRLVRPEIEELFDLVDVGTPVLIVSQ